MAQSKQLSKFTPGPWHERAVTIINLEGDLTQTEECSELGQVKTDETIAYVPLGVVGYEKSYAGIGNANARLISHAPEMYELLSRLCDREHVDLCWEARQLKTEIDARAGHR